MTITLITQEQYDRIMEIQKNYPLLTFQNEGYEYPDKSKWDENHWNAFNEMTEILSKHIKGFSKFNNFKISKKGFVMLRFQYNWTIDDENKSSYFIGVGYLSVDELLEGFDKSEIIKNP
jgi:hypothetical protein